MYSSDWFSQNIKNWEKWLSELKGKPNLRFLEIGCFEGRATVWLLENILTGENCSIDTIDMFGGGMEDGDKGAFYNSEASRNYEENIKPFPDKVYTHVGMSQVILRRYFNVGETKDKDVFDFIYIDGSHRSAEVLEDTVLAWRLLKDGGVMVWDDYGLKRYSDSLMNPSVGIDAFLRVFEGKYQLVSKGYQICIRKVALSPK